MMGHNSNCNQSFLVYTSLGHLYHTPPSTDASLLPNDPLCSSANDFMLDNILQSLMQTTTPTIAEDPYYYTWLPAWTKVIATPPLKVNLPLSAYHISIPHQRTPGCIIMDVPSLIVPKPGPCAFFSARNLSGI